ncbi:MAG: ACP S-malonyltransferase [Granulosicoccus sp.]
MTFAVVFPGQGSQSVGMLSELAKTSSQVKTTFEEAADVLGVDLWKLSQESSAEALNDTVVTQPLMFTSGVAVWRALREAGMPMPSAVAGHSLGEFSALVAAESMQFRDGLTLVQQRAKLMAQAVPEGEGGMAALIGLEDDTVVSLCESVSGARVSEAVNFNAPGQVVISGHLDALQETISSAREQGCKRALMLAVSVPNHSSLMRKAGEQLGKTIDSLSFGQPVLPLLQNNTARAASQLEDMLTHLKEHVFSPVYWTRTIARLRDEHAVTTLLEAGPGKVLTGLSRRIDRALPAMPVYSPETLEEAVAVVCGAMEERVPST